MRTSRWLKIASGVGLLGAAAGGFSALYASGLLADISDGDKLKAWIEHLGAWGPVVVIVTEAVAIVASPLPSAPIAVAAGAAYGPVWGTLYIVLGAELGSVAAFLIARTLGYDAVRSWLPAGAYLDKLGAARSQAFLMWIVFASRLLPFLSFDAVSYAAGLTQLAFWRFAAATIVGVVPIALALNYAGSVAFSNSTLMVGILGLLAVTSASPFAFQLIRRVLRRARGGN